MPRAGVRKKKEKKRGTEEQRKRSQIAPSTLSLSPTPSPRLSGCPREEERNECKKKGKNKTSFSRDLTQNDSIFFLRKTKDKKNKGKKNKCFKKNESKSLSFSIYFEIPAYGRHLITLGSSRSGTRAILLFSLSFAELIFSLMCCLPALRTSTLPVAVTLMRFEAAFFVLSLPPPCLASTRRGVARAGAGARCECR